MRPPLSRNRPAVFAALGLMCLVWSAATRPLAAQDSTLAQTPPRVQDSSKVKVEIEGVEGELKRNVLAVMQIAREGDGHRLPKARVGQLHQRAEEDIAVALQPYGFYRPTVVKRLELVGGEWIARYAIDPGPAVVLKQVDVRIEGPGSEAPEFGKLIPAFLLHQGDTLHHVDYENGKLAFLRTASDSGYLDADFDTTAILVNRETATAEIHLVFRTGERFQFGPVRFQQNILNDAFLQTRVPWKVGDPWRQDKILELQTALANDPYFSRVDVLPQRRDAKGLIVPVRVLLEYRPPRSFEFGAGYGTDTGPRARAGIVFRRLNRRGHNAEVQVKIAQL
ncbi:MAG: POTRA domain-containing protein, partial [Gemmatimonadota bacterium]